MPIVLAFGDKDASFDNDLILYDSLLANHSPVDMVVAQGVSHQIPASMNEIMFKSYRYLLDSNTISLSRISTVIIDSKTPEFKVTVRNIRDKQDRALEVSAYSATPSLIGNPTVDYVAGSDSAVLTMKPVGTITTTSYTKIVVEVKEINGTAIEQTVFDVKVKVKPRYPVKASSQYTFLTGPENAIDGIYKTKWTTQQADSQWICVDLCRNISVNGVIILWAQAAKEYKITVSTDSITWNEVYSNFMGIGGRDTISFEPVKSRYIQLDCIKRVSNAFRITEIEIDTGQFTGIKNILLNNDQGRLSLFPNVLSASDCRTTLSYSLQKPTQVNLSVYNVQGQKLRTFVNDFQQSGDYSIDFEIADDQKNQFTSGMYLFVISTPEFRDQKKMMIIR